MSAARASSGACNRPVSRLLVVEKIDYSFQFTMYDAIVVGAGPGGDTTSTLMAHRGLQVLMVDKASFPRDKICGDAVSGKSVDALQELGLIEHFQRNECLGSWGVTFSGPSGDHVDIPFTKALDRPIAPGFVCAREVFDDILVKLAVSEGVELRENTTVNGANH